MSKRRALDSPCVVQMAKAQVLPPGYRKVHFGNYARLLQGNKSVYMHERHLADFLMFEWFEWSREEGLPLDSSTVRATVGVTFFCSPISQVQELTEFSTPGSTPLLTIMPQQNMRVSLYGINQPPPGSARCC
ncbi:hypothetical protein Y032_0019g3808 [Ancylostoma ceylanicum]|uniref:Uncharacterized protein n=1 Tax=Ancylostoma ceylanicum TaxID=53326 RepID=A0A016V3W0_9BILA|nr:hypothetical protein Y032_0019g3808 [Ancylostoma ceylanicum]